MRHAYLEANLSGWDALSHRVAGLADRAGCGLPPVVGCSVNQCRAPAAHGSWPFQAPPGYL